MDGNSKPEASCEWLKQDTILKLRAFFERNDSAAQEMRDRVVRKLNKFFMRTKIQQELLPKNMILEPVEVRGTSQQFIGEEESLGSQVSATSEEKIEWQESVSKEHEENQIQRKRRRRRRRQGQEVGPTKRCWSLAELSLEQVICTIFISFFCLNACQTTRAHRR